MDKVLKFSHSCSLLCELLFAMARKLPPIQWPSMTASHENRSQDHSTMKAKTIHGGCLCRAVRYEATGPPCNVTHCHCAHCRRNSGAPFVTWASFKRKNFRITQGQMRDIWWAGCLRSFCPRCGTALTFTSAPNSDEVNLTVCSLDDPRAIVPADHTWVEDQLPWIRLADELPVHPQKRRSSQLKEKGIVLREKSRTPEKR